MVDHPPLRRNTGFQLLWFGTTVSQLGTEITKLAVPLFVLALTGSPAWAGIIAGAGVAGSILVLMPAGVWVDRWDRRRTLVTGQALRVVNSACLSALVLSGHVQVWQFVLFGVVDGVCAAFTDLVRYAAIRGLVPVAQLRTAYMQEESRSHAARLAGPPLGGLLYGLAPAVPFVVDTVTFVVALVSGVLAKVPRRPGRASAVPSDDGPGSEPTRPSMRREVGDALAWLWHRRGLREVYGVLTALNLLGGAFMIPLIVLVGERGGGALGTGTVLAGAGIGGLVGALGSTLIGRLLPVGAMMITIVAVFGTAVAAMALPFGPWWPMVPLIVIALSTPSINVVVSAVNAQLVPEDMLGRMNGSLTTVARGLAPLGPVLGGALAATLGAAGTLVVLGAALVLTAAGAATSPELRRFTGEDGSDSAVAGSPRSSER
ncbi:MFS transporter [Pseudonocardia xinjiangensis]|uniref:MFS transporter n=1 Tax=Pseudonocardia xinjiangensis TaxID=75289 RepID=UPI003D9113CE